MNYPIRAGILGAGLGSRLQAKAKAKPLAPLHGTSLLALLVQRLRECGLSSIHCALRDELLDAADRSSLPSAPDLSYLFVNTESSLHTLVELSQAMGTSQGPALFSMADTVLRPKDLRAFVEFCRALGPEDCAVLVTSFVDDEKPLWVTVDGNGAVMKFGGDRGAYVTSGLYFLQPQAMEIAKELQHSGVHKMRNFLAALVERGEPIKTFVVAKTIDVDHPSDLEKAEEFLRSE